MAKNNELPKRDDPTALEPRPRPAAAPIPGSNISHLKQDITSGATGDKVAVFDPGMANVGTGAEAAGTPMTPEMIELARKTEAMHNAPPGDPGQRAGIGLGPRLLIVLLGLVALGLGALFLS